jgi:hypothetical protein
MPLTLKAKKLIISRRIFYLGESYYFQEEDLWMRTPPRSDIKNETQEKYRNVEQKI